jgi:hypothetical protein
MNKEEKQRYWEKHGYDHCIGDCKNFGVRFCEAELKRMLELTGGNITNSYKGYKMALEDILKKRGELK